MKFNNYECAKIINYQFKRLRQAYTKMISHLNGINYLIVSQQEIDQWLTGEYTNSPVLFLNTYYYSWDNAELKFIDRKLEREIEYNLLQADEGYIEYIDNTFGKHWSFIKEFKGSISTYINNGDEATRCINSLYAPPEKFNKNEFKKSIELQLIFMFDIWEGLYKKYDKAYNRYYKESEFSNLHKTNPDYIQLGYGENNLDAIDLMHKTLALFKLIECNFEEFAAHFDPFASTVPNPIVWLGDDTQLLVLLLGKDLKDNDDLRNSYYQLKLKKELTFQQILDHFKLGDDTTDRTLSSNYANMLKRKTIKKPRPIQLLINDLNALSTR